MEDFEFMYQGVLFCVSVEEDLAAGPPWEMSEGHGVVIECLPRNKHPHEWVLYRGRRQMLVYDVKESLRTAARDMWGLDDRARDDLAARLGRPPTQAEIRAEAVRLDYEYLKGWTNDLWHYWTVVVTPVVEGVPVHAGHKSCGGVEGFPDNVKAVAAELASEALADLQPVASPVNQESCGDHY